MRDLERERRINDILLRAFEQPTEERAAFVVEACGNDTDLRAGVEALMAGDDGLSEFLAPPAPSSAHESMLDEELELPHQLGRFRLEEELGRGGMGSVYLAQQREPIERRVAVKLLRPGNLHRDGELRFHAEGQALARLSHPAVAQIFEVGTSEDGRPYIVLEHVGGRPIHDFCDHHRLGLTARLDLFLAVCEGVLHAHQKGIIHRDIKPSNVLVAGDAERPIPKLIDFGIAKSLDDRPLTEETLTTGEAWLGTPAYLSPEVLAGDEVDLRTDVYGLGVLLYELMLGGPPFSEPDQHLFDLLRRIRFDPVPDPDEFLASRSPGEAAELAVRRGRTRRTLVAALRREFLWIVRKAMAKDPAQRYPSVSALAADMKSFRCHEPVTAGPHSALYLVRKFVRRHRAAVVASAFVLVALVAALVGMTLEARRAQREAELAEASLDFMTDVFMASSPDMARGEPPTAEELLERGADAARQRLFDQPLARARLLTVLGGVFAYMSRYDEAESAFDEVLNLRAGELGEDHPSMVSALWQKARIHRIRGQLDEAEALLRRAVDLSGSAPAEDRVMILRELGVVHLFQSRYDESRATLEKSLRAAEDVFKEEDWELSLIVEDLGRAHGALGDLEAAERFARQVVEMRAAHLPADHPGQAIAAGRLGEILMVRGRLDEAEPLLQRAAEIARKAYGPDHADLGAFVFKLAKLQAHQGRFDEAEELYLQALAIKEKAFGPEHRDVAVIVNSLGLLRWRQGDYAGAEPFYRRALDLKTRLLGEEHSSVAIGMSNLGEVLWKQGELDDAEPLLRRALEIQEQTIGLDHADRGFPLHALAMVLFERGQLPAAEEVFAEVYDLRTRHLDPDDADLDDTRREYARLLERLGRDEEAARVLATRPADPDSAQGT